ncbi:MAG: pilus assembly protein PilP [Aquisalimonadaceae bacterium]
MIRTMMPLFRESKGAALALTLFGSVLLVGCTQDTSDLQAYIDQINARPAPALPPFEEPEPAPTHHYPTTLERDPFDRLSFAQRESTDVAGSGPRPDPNRAKESLEQFPLDALRMAGLLEGQGERWGLVRDPQGVVHRVKEGNYVGQNHGRIVSVTEQRIEVVELVRTGERSWTERNAALATRE